MRKLYASPPRSRDALARPRAGDEPGAEPRVTRGSQGEGRGAQREVPPPEKSEPRRKTRTKPPAKVGRRAARATSSATTSATTRRAARPSNEVREVREVVVAKVKVSKAASSAPSSTLERARRLAPASRVASAEDHLAAALRAESPRERAAHARRGLARRSGIDRTTQAMLLRQLYLGHYEARDFKRAAAIGAQMVELGVLADVAHQDAARALQALGDLDAATGHLRLAARTSPASRRAFHWWTLGSVCFVHGRHADALAALSRAVRWSTRDRPLYKAHAAVVQCAAGLKVRGLKKLARDLARVPAGQGYGRFVLGQLALYDGRPADAKKHLTAFVRRTVGGRPILALALAPELELAQRVLDELCAAERRAA